MKQFYLQIAACFVVATSYGKNPENALRANTFDDNLSTSNTTFNSEDPINFGYFELTLESDAKRDVTEFYFYEQSTYGLDPGYDAGVMGKAASSFAIYSKLLDPGDYAHVDLAIQSLPFKCLSEETIIPLGVNMAQGLSASIKISNQYIQSEIEIILEDTQLNTQTLLTEGSYTFTADTALLGVGRFNIIIRNTTTVEEETTPTEEELVPDPENSLTALKIFLSKNEKAITIKGDVVQNTTLKLTDLQGRPVLDAVLQGKKMNRINVSNLKPGIYIIILQENSNRITKKVILN
ncbi:putative secreted protein (Por secretion system target) [Gelidibacter sediminis]|uniref:Putative secreted protein (Por secretion system target) n=1 Tax=Gelidibacter sediminis TaxID=1608710 RepID=A0A4R7Q7R1_9FLAO|nr:T9SS type A sorting domain-containing protein [Gelidibacter sediminis]TDU42909.1 putative secreted protein (Por secretion system target) [Gelidibacter sediminis]